MPKLMYMADNAAKSNLELPDVFRRRAHARLGVAEPTSSAAGGVVLWKAVVGLLGIGVVATGLGFLVLWPKTAREGFVRLVATLAGSAILGPLLVAAVYGKFPWLFAAGVSVAASIGMEPWLGVFMVSAPVLAMAGLPFWWLLGALVLWLEKRRGQDLGQIVADARADVARVVAP
jgi:hypothetical protein